MRLFISINLSNTIKDTIIDLQNDLRNNGINGNYTNTRNLHLTLAFIGEYNNTDKVLRTIKTVPFNSFSLSLNGNVGSFGDLLWVGIKKEKKLLDLTSQLRNALHEADIPFDMKSFKPHITILRKAELSFQKDFDICSVKPSEASMVVNKISLMNSHRENGKLIYYELGFIQSGTKGDR